MNKIVAGTAIVLLALLIFVIWISGGQFLQGIYMAHGYCYKWTMSLVAMHGISDLVVFISYSVLSYYLFKILNAIRVYDTNSRVAFLGFICFIAFCGIGHLFDVVSIWYSVYWLSGYVKISTAAVSAAVAVWMSNKYSAILSMVNDGIEHHDEVNRLNIELTKFKELHTDALRASGVGIWEHIISTGELIWDDRVLEIWGKRREDYHNTYDEFKQTIHPDDLSNAIGVYEESVRNPNIPYDNVFRIITGDEEVRVIRAKGRFVVGSNGVLSKAIGAVWDVTEVEESQAQLEDKKLQFEMIQKASLDGFWDWNFSSNYEYLSPRFKEILGYKDEELENSPEAWRSLIVEDDLKIIDAALKDHLENGAPYDPIVRFRHKDGHTAWIMCRGQAVFGPDGKAVRMIGAHTDITQIKETEALLLRSNKDLERFAYIASHDLQEPLRMVSAFLGLIEDRYSEVLDEKGREWINFAVDGASRMSTLINDLLKYSRAVNVNIDSEEFDLRKAILQILAPYSDTNFTVSEMPIVHTSKVLVERVIYNLVNNAVKYGAKNVEITHEIRGILSVICVSDDGPGIANEYHDIIFEPFKRLSRDSSGSGIGLAICRALAIRLGGECRVDSEEGKGAKFFFSFKNGFNSDS